MKPPSLQLPILRADTLLEGGGKFPLPEVAPIRQRFDETAVDDPGGAVRAAWDKERIGALVRPGMRVGVAVGSRGITALSQIVSELIRLLKEAGAQVCILPAMGSHGGPTPQGQAEVLSGMGISEQTMGVPVVSSLEVAQIATGHGGHPVWFSTDALACDGVIIVNRVKPHTDFYGGIESGIMKMCAVGLGKHRGASSLHARGFAHFGENMLEAAQLVLAHANVLCGLAIVENAYKAVASVDFLPNRSGELEQRERALLRKARALMPALPLKDIDVLLVQRIGKDISGAMFDPNVTGRRKIWHVPDFDSPTVKVMAALELTQASHGNAAGMSVADICSTRLLEQVDFAATYASLITATIPQHAHVPMFFARDDEVLRAAAQIAQYGDPSSIALCWIQDTSHLDRLWVSENALKRIDARSAVQVLGPPRPLPFDAHGLLHWSVP